MPTRAKSVPPPRTNSRKEEDNDEEEHLGREIELLPARSPQLKDKGKKKKSVKRSSSKNAHHRGHAPLSIANRPEWNNDTHIDGYDDLDENGKIKRKGDVGGGGYSFNGEKAKKYQDEINRMWSESLRL